MFWSHIMESKLLSEVITVTLFACKTCYKNKRSCYRYDSEDEYHFILITPWWNVKKSGKDQLCTWLSENYHFPILRCTISQLHQLLVIANQLFTLKAPNTTAADDIHKYFFFFSFLEKITRDVSSESSARHMTNQALFALKDKSKKLKCRLLQFLFDALRVTNATNYITDSVHLVFLHW